MPSPLPEWMVPEGQPPDLAKAARKRAQATLSAPAIRGVEDSSLTKGDVVTGLAGFLPGIGEAQDIDAYNEADKKGDTKGKVLSAVSLGLPLGITAASLALLLRAGKSPRAARVPLRQAGMVGARFDKGPEVKLSGSRQTGREVSDAQMRVDTDILDALAKLPKGERSILLREVVHHPEVFKHYPEAKTDLKIEVLPKGSRDDGFYDPATGTIGIAPTRIQDADTVLKHELQHFIEKMDERLGKPKDDQRKYIISPHEREARLTEQRGLMTQGELEEFPRGVDQATQTRLLREMVRSLNPKKIKVTRADGSLIGEFYQPGVSRDSFLEDIVVSPYYYPDLNPGRRVVAPTVEKKPVRDLTYAQIEAMSEMDSADRADYLRSLENPTPKDERSLAQMWKDSFSSREDELEYIIETMSDTKGASQLELDELARAKAELAEIRKRSK